MSIKVNVCGPNLLAASNLIDIYEPWIDTRFVSFGEGTFLSLLLGTKFEQIQLQEETETKYHHHDEHRKQEPTGLLGNNKSCKWSIQAPKVK